VNHVFGLDIHEVTARLNRVTAEIISGADLTDAKFAEFKMLETARQRLIFLNAAEDLLQDIVAYSAVVDRETLPPPPEVIVLPS